RSLIVSPLPLKAYPSNAQHDQLNKSETNQQHRKRHGIVFEPMPIIGKHHVHPYSNAWALKDGCGDSQGEDEATVLLINNLPHACFRRISPQRFWFRGLWRKPGQRFAVCGGNPAWQILQQNDCRLVAGGNAARSSRSNALSLSTTSPRAV